VRGSFNEFEGFRLFDSEDSANSHFELTIQAARTHARNADRDGHIRSNDFLDMESDPKLPLPPPTSSRTATTTAACWWARG
jgi:polyisoprenoid-binding protein YceI